MVDNTNKIADLKKQIEKLQAEQAAFEEMSDEERLAVSLHDLMCHYNHSDGCGWFYEVKNGVHNWGGQSHQPYFSKARMVTKFCNIHKLTTDSAIELLKLIK
jgi:hypothetical protein